MEIKRNYQQELDCIIGDIHSDIKYLLKNNNDEINVPYYYEEDTDLELIDEWNENNFDVRIGDPYNNTRIKVEDGYSRMCDDVTHEIEVMQVWLNGDGYIMLNAKDGIYSIQDIENVQELIFLYEKLYKIVNK